MMETLAKKHILTLALISIPAAVLTATVPWFCVTDLEEQVGITTGLFSVYFIVFFWIGKQIWKWIEYRKRVKAVKEIVGALSEIRLDTHKKVKK